MKAMLMGHVPPARVDSKMSWDETCWQKYTLWQKQYRDVIVGNFFGHMNIDHFMLQDFKDIKKGFKKGYSPAELEGPRAKYAVNEELTVMSAADYLIDLRGSFSKIPTVSDKLRIFDDEEGESSWLDSLVSIFMSKEGKKKHGKKPQNPFSKIGGEYGERYSLSFVQASVIPNFFPTLRVFEYNITGLEDLNVASVPSAVQALSRAAVSEQIPMLAGKSNPSFIDEFASDIALSSHKGVGEEKKKKKTKKYKFKVPQPPSKSTPPGPAYSPQTLSLLGYTQYFANITHINNDFLNAAAEKEQEFDTEEWEEDVGEERWKKGKHSGKTKKGKARPKKFTFKVEYDTFSDKIFGLKDLTVRSYIDLAKVIGNSEHALQPAVHDEADQVEQPVLEEDVAVSKRKRKPKKSKSNKVWHAFVKRAFVGTMDPEEIEQKFLIWQAKQNVTQFPESGSLEL
jgi:endopolyphosphatase